MAALFYENPVLVNASLHAGAGLKKIESLGFARAGNAIPVNLVEFAFAMRSYPIAFVGEGDAAFPAIIVGLEQNNLFVDADGQWKKGLYVPAYIRRYPFIFADQAGSDMLSLCVDDVPGVLDANGGEKLFEDGKPAPAVERALEFCKAYHAAAMDTQAFTRAVQAKGLLVDRQADTELSAGGKFTLRGFRTIDEAKLGELDSETLIDWHRKGWLGAVYAQVLSSLNWGSLIELLAAQKAVVEEAAPPAKGSKKLS